MASRSSSCVAVAMRSGSSSLSLSRRSCRRRSRLVSSNWSRSSAPMMALSRRGFMRSAKTPSRSLHSQMRASEVMECSRMARSRPLSRASSWPFSSSRRAASATTRVLPRVTRSSAIGGPFIAKGGGNFAERALLLRGGQFADERGEAAFFVAEKLRDGRARPRRGRGPGAFSTISSRVTRNSSACAGLRRWFLRACVLGGGEHGRELRGGIGELAEILEDLVERGELVLELAGAGEGGEILVGVRNGRVAQLERVALFRRHGEVPVLLQRLLGRFPPFLEFRLAENIRQRAPA